MNEKIAAIPLILIVRTNEAGDLEGCLAIDTGGVPAPLSPVTVIPKASASYAPALILKAAIAGLEQAAEAHKAGKGVSGFSFMQVGGKA